MHKLVRERLEEFLRGDISAERRAEIEQHFAGCPGCRNEVASMQEQARLLQLLRPVEPLEPAPGFYGRVMATVNSRRNPTLAQLFVESVFGRWLAYACLATIAVLGGYLFYTERGSSVERSSPMTLLVRSGERVWVVGSPTEDRQRVLVSLASYRE